MIKLLSNSFDFGEPNVQLLHIPRYGHTLVKSASDEMRDFLKEVRAEKGKTKLLVLAMGAGESYGPNRNGDLFKEVDLIERHPTFEKFAKLYKHHVNKDPERSYGDVEKSAYNHRMRRVELVVAVDNAKAPDVVKKANAGEDIPVSMSCKVAYDVCSICGKKSAKISDYCGHLKEAMTKIMPDGRQVCAINPNPTFFDISVVYKPADRIAYVLEKVAHAAVPSALLAQELGLSEFDFEPALFDKHSQDVRRRRDLLRKLATIEKKIEGILRKPEPETQEEQFIKEDAPKALVVVIPTPGADASEGSIKDLLGGLADQGVIVSPQEFSDLMNDGSGPDISGMLPGIFSRLLQAPGLDRLLDRSLFDFDRVSSPGLPKSLMQELAANRSLFHRPASRRVMKLTIMKPPRLKFHRLPGGVGVSDSSAVLSVEKAAESPAADLAVGYALYKLGALTKASAGRESDELLPLLSVLQNYVEA